MGQATTKGLAGISVGHTAISTVEAAGSGLYWYSVRKPAGS